MKEQTDKNDINNVKEITTNKQKFIMKSSPFFRYLIILLSIFVILQITNLIIILLPIDPEILHQKITTSFIFVNLAMFVIVAGLLIYMLPIFIKIFQIKKTAVQIEIKEEQINKLMIPGIVVFVLGIIFNIMGIVRYFV